MWDLRDRKQKRGFMCGNKWDEQLRSGNWKIHPLRGKWWSSKWTGKTRDSNVKSGNVIRKSKQILGMAEDT